MTPRAPGVDRAITALVALTCTAAQNPIGSTLALDFGALALPVDPTPREKPRGEWRLTIYSPWRVQSEDEVLFDSNVDGGADSPLALMAHQLEGATVVRVSTRAPAWDLDVEFDRGIRLLVFGDVVDDRDVAWYLLDRASTSYAALPVVRPLGAR